MRQLLIPAALVAAVLCLPASPAHAASTCQGLPATIEASSGAVLGTPGPDVIVAGGSVTEVDSGEGDDTVCVVGNTVPIQIVTRSGDDRVDTTAGLVDVEAYLGTGADTYRGGDRRDAVSTQGHGGLDTIVTGAGGDDVAVASPVVVDTGADDDHVLLVGADEGSAVELGTGSDTFTAGGKQRVRVDLVRGTVTIDGTTSPLLDAENVFALAHRVVVVGDDGPNRIQAGSCQADLSGGAGDDTLNEISDNVHVPGSCRHHRARIDGGAGNDRMRGSRGDDVLRGGPGATRRTASAAPTVASPRDDGTASDRQSRGLMTPPATSF